MARRRSLTALAAAVAAGAVLASTADAATTRVTPASGVAGSQATLVGSGFLPASHVRIRMAGRLLGEVRTGQQGSFRFRVRIGALDLGVKRLAASDRRRVVVNRFAVTSTKQTSSSMIAHSAGHRFRLAPVAGAAGATIAIRAWSYAPNGSVRIFLGESQQGSPRPVDGRGRLETSLEVPDIGVGTYALSLRSSRATLRAPFRVRSASTGPGCHKTGPAPGPHDDADQVHLAWVDDPARTLTVVWHTDSAVSSQVEYRELAAAAWDTAMGGPRPAGTQGTLHEVTLRSLVPETTYEYRVRADGGGWSDVFTTCTAPAEGGTIDFVYVADTGLIGREDGLATGTKQVRDEIAKLSPLFVLGGGDYAYFDRDKRFGTLENTIDAWFNQSQPFAGSAALMPAYGNHEVLLGEGFTNWQRRFPTPAGHHGPHGENEDYSFDVGEAHFTSITAVHDRTGLDQGTLDWIDDDLASAKARGQRWLIPFMHVPPFSDGTNHGQNVVLRGQLAPIFERRGVHLVLTSHTQNYERSYPLTDATETSYVVTSQDKRCYTTDDGIVWMKISPGGKLSNINGSFAGFKHANPPSWTAERDNTHHAYAHFSVGPTGISATDYGVTGDGSSPVVIDHFRFTTETC